MPQWCHTTTQFRGLPESNVLLPLIYHPSSDLAYAYSILKTGFNDKEKTDIVLFV